MKKSLRSLRLFLFVAMVFIACLIPFSVGAEGDPINIAALKGPTGMGLAKLITDTENDPASYPYQFTLTGTVDEIVTGISSGKIQGAAVPCNLASILSNKTEGKVKVAAINTLGVLYILERGTSIQSVDDLKGKTLFSTGKGTTPEFVLNHILVENGINPETDLTIEYKSESTELAALFQEKSEMIALLPQPYVTIVQNQNEDVRIALSLTDEWTKVTSGKQQVTGCVILASDWIEKDPESVNSFLANYELSTDYVNANPKEASEMIAALGIVPSAAIAEKAIPFSNIKFISGQDMKDYVGSYLEVLFQADPKSTGGKLPDESFYYLAANQ